MSAAKTCRIPTEDIANALYVAFSNRGVGDKSNDEIRVAVDRLVLFAKHRPLESLPRAFRVASTETTHKELAELEARCDELARALSNSRANVERRCKRLADKIESLHQTSIQALCSAPIKSDSLSGKLEIIDIGAVRTALPMKLRDASAGNEKLAADLRLLARTARDAPSRVSKDQGRDKDLFAHAIARRVALDYEKITGNRPTIVVDPARKAKAVASYAGAPSKPHARKAGYPRGPFLELLSDIFSILGIAADPLLCAREAQKSYPSRHSESVDE